ncbi:hypothetical protein Tco_0926365 [Tanacetum coccineum]|uniref:Uncharacterized protein n=1 Tax=Tanacetum coccineum TaxID=301880 RepID=A0ABQ5D9L1_9ASTR
MLEREKLSRLNFNDWFHQLRIVLRVEKKLNVLEQPMTHAAAVNAPKEDLEAWNAQYDHHNEVASLMLGSMSPKLQRQFENYSPYDMLQEMTSMLEKQVGVKRTVELSQPDGPNFKVNGHRVKHYFGGDIPSKAIYTLDRIPRGFSPREPTFQVTLDALALTLCYPAFLITADVPEICPRVPGRDFDDLPFEEDTISFLRDLSHTGVINSPNDVVIDQMHQPWRTFVAIINRNLSRKTSGLDKFREVPPKVTRKFKKASSSKKESELVPRDEEPIKKGKRLKTPAKKSASKPATGIVIREPPVETKSKRKEKEKVDVAHGKGIKLLSDVALSEKAQMKEARMKSLRDFHKTHPSGSGTIFEKPPSVEKITSTGNDEDDSNNKQESSDESSKQENESEEQELDPEKDEESNDDD